MNKIFTFLVLFAGYSAFAQSYAPAVGQVGTTAIKNDSSIISNWATGIAIERGFLDIEDPSFELNGSNKVSFGIPDNALYFAEGNPTDVVSLGDSGVATLTFEWPIINGSGYDFAVFENSFSDEYLELAFVEVSSNGIDFVRFPSHSETQTLTQISGFGNTQATRIYNLAGKYRGGYGTPFDLQQLIDSTQLDLNNITHVRLVDVVGSIGSSAQYDAQGNKINDPYPTNYASGGFDLDGVGVINQMVGLEENEATSFTIYPNPANGILHISSGIKSEEVQIFNSNGKLVKSLALNSTQTTIDISSLKKGLYFINIGAESKKLIVLD